MVTHDAPFLASVLSDNNKMFLSLEPPGSFAHLPFAEKYVPLCYTSPRKRTVVWKGEAKLLYLIQTHNGVSSRKVA